MLVLVTLYFMIFLRFYRKKYCDNFCRLLQFLFSALHSCGMHYTSGTVDRNAGGRCICNSGRQAEAACAFKRWQHFYAWNDVMASVL